MDINLSLQEIQSRYSLSPTHQHLAKKGLLFALVALGVVGSGWIGTSQIFESALQVDRISTEEDSRFLTETNTQIDAVLEMVGQGEEIGRKSGSFGDEVQIAVKQANPFVPLLKPVAENVVKKEVPQLPPEPQLNLTGIARVGDRYMAIIADTGGKSQVVMAGDKFDDWVVKAIKADAVRLNKGKRNLTLAWEGR